MSDNAHALDLSALRALIDAVDDALIVLMAGRARLTQRAGDIKVRLALPSRDSERERRVRARAVALARRLSLSPSIAVQLMNLALRQSHRQHQRRLDPDHGAAGGKVAMIPVMSSVRSLSPKSMQHLLAWLPSPKRLRPLVRRIPEALQHRVLQAVMAQTLKSPLAEGALDFMAGRRLGIEVVDLGLRWTIELREGVLRADDGPAEASVCGSATDLLLLAGRLEDADTLFFQRRLTLTGDTELGLAARNLLDRLPWESIPLGLRIVLHRGADLLRAARAAHRADPGTASGN